MLALVTLVCIKRCLVLVIFQSVFKVLCISFNGCTNCLMFLVAFEMFLGYSQCVQFYYGDFKGE